MIRTSLKILLPLSLVLFGCPSSSPAPEVQDFKATPASITQGSTSTLSWVVSGATQISLDNGLGIQTGSSVDVQPTVNTTYTLTATGLGGTTTATVSVTVTNAVPKPVITAFGASPSDVAVGSNTTLSWTVTGAVNSLVITPGPITLSTTTLSGSQSVGPVNAATTYTLTATNAGGSTTATAAVTTHAAALHLQYTDPASTTAKLKLVRNAASTNSHLILDMKVGAAPITAFGIAMNVPFDTASTGMLTFTNSTSSSLGGLTVGSISAGSSPPTAAAILGSSASAMPSLLTVGVAKKKSASTDPDDTWAAGATLFSIAFDMTGTATAGTNVFTAAGIAANPKFKAAALHKDGTESVGKADIAFGDFIISN